MGRMLANLCDAVIPRSGETTAYGVEPCDAGLRGLPITAFAGEAEAIALKTIAG